MTVSAKQLAASVRVLVLDVDGVLTDGGLYYDHKGNVGKRFNVQDGLGIKLAQSVGLEIAVITGLKSKAVDKRVRELGITDYFSGHLAKIPLLEEIRSKHNLGYENMAYLGDDWVDAGPMRTVGLPMAVANAQPEVKKLAAYTCEACGGQGAVREAIRFILEARGDLESLWQEWQSR